MNLLLTFAISLIFSLIAFLMLKKQKVSLKLKISLAVIVFIGSFIRLYQIDKYPVGLNQDEASIGYEAISIFKYGIDRFGMSYPVHLISWGSGQNALYAYLIMPLIRIITNDITLIRFPMAIFGSITLLFILYFIKRESLNNKGIIILLLFAIMPWHIMKSRWGLESNIFPDLVIYGLITLYFGIKDKKKVLNIIAAIIFGLSTYAYGTSYLYIPLLLLITYIYLIKNKKIAILDALVYFMITAAVALPMIIFVIINYFNLNTVKILGITIPRLYANRFMMITSVNGNSLQNCIHNLIGTLNIIISGNDHLPLNAMPYFGTYYFISIPFLVYGLIIYFQKYKDNLYLKLSFIALITSLIVSMMVEPNINRINFIWFPIYIFIILGVVNVSHKNIKISIICIYAISFIFFIGYYFDKYQKDLAGANNEGLKEAILSVDNNKKDIYITDTINQPYIFWLYYNKISPYYYLENQNILDYNVMFQRVYDIDNVHFYLSNNNDLKNKTYLMPSSSLNEYDTTNCKVNNYKNYSVLDC